MTLATATPESVGVPATTIDAFLRDLHQSRFNMHSILIMRHGKLITEAYRPPYDQDRKQRMFSVSKTFAALAAGLLIDEGRLSLTDKVVDFFPEYCPDPVHPLLAAATIYDMLTMQDPHDRTTHGYGIKSNWLESWFLTPPCHPPGTVFQYNTTSTNLVAAIVERVTGTKMIDYMYPRLLTPIGFSEGCYCGETPDGDSFAGSAVMCTPRDLAKLVQLVMNGGEWDGKQLISQEFILKLRSKQVDTTLMGIPVEGMFGYGFFTWHLRNGGFTFFGIHGQFGIGFPDTGLVVVATGNTADNYDVENDILFSQFLDRVFWHFGSVIAPPPAIISPHPVIAGLTRNLQEKDNRLGFTCADSDNSGCEIHSMEIPGQARNDETSPILLPHILAPGTPSSPTAAKIAGRTYKLHPNQSGWQTVKFEFTHNEGKILYTNRRGDKAISFGLGHAIPFMFPEERGIHAAKDPYDTYISGAWADDRTLVVNLHNITTGFMQLCAVFSQDTVTILIKPTEGYRKDYGGYMYGQCV